jgi:SAM-dependent methyltransferase
LTTPTVDGYVGRVPTGKQSFVDGMSTLALRLRRSRRVDVRTLAPNGVVKVNLGSGLEVAPGWINLDASLHALVAGWPVFAQRALFVRSGYSRLISEDEYLRRLHDNVFIHHDVVRSLPFVDNSVDFLFSSHLIEHLTRSACVGLLREALRVLRPGGVIRLGTPDLERVVALYQSGDRRRMLEEYFFRADEGRLAEHSYVYDFTLLEEACREAGFAEVERRRFREGLVPDVELLDNRPEETLFVEAVKR